MDQSCNRSASAIGYVGHCTGYGTGHGYTVEERHDNVGRALSDKLCIGVGARAGHPVGNRCRQERFYRTENGDCEGRGQQGVDCLHAEFESMGLGNIGRQVAETVADCCHMDIGAICMEQPHGECHQYDSYQSARQTF